MTEWPSLQQAVRPRSAPRRPSSPPDRPTSADDRHPAATARPAHRPLYAAYPARPTVPVLPATAAHLPARYITPAAAGTAHGRPIAGPAVLTDAARRLGRAATASRR